jgi:hypothetical protein
MDDSEVKPGMIKYGIVWYGTVQYRVRMFGWIMWLESRSSCWPFAWDRDRDGDGNEDKDWAFGKSKEGAGSS